MNEFVERIAIGAKVTTFILSLAAGAVTWMFVAALPLVYISDIYTFFGVIPTQPSGGVQALIEGGALLWTVAVLIGGVVAVSVKISD